MLFLIAFLASIFCGGCDSALFATKEWNIDTTSLMSLWMQYIPSFAMCMKQNQSSSFVERPYSPGSVSIVQSISNGRQNDEFDYATSMMACYCKKHNCRAHQNSVNPSRYPYHKHFFTARWRSIKERFWMTSEGVFGMDTDLIPVNFDKNISDYIASVSGRASVILHGRRNQEIVASPIGFKTHDKFANCFFEYFNCLGRFGQTNYDNGDILEVILKIVAPEVVEKCQDYRLLNYGQYMECFGSVFSKFTEAEKLNANHADPNVGIGPYGNFLMIYI